MKIVLQQDFYPCEFILNPIYWLELVITFIRESGSKQTDNERIIKDLG